MTSQWYMNVNKARPRHAPTWRKAFKWTHFTTISKREWISTVIVYVYEVIWSIHFHSIKWNYDNRIGESPWRSWCYLICIITHGLCSYNARLFNDDVTAIGASYWRRREFPNYARLHRGRMVFSECFKVFFSIVRHLGREPNFWAENRIFKNFLKSLKTCLVGVFWVFQGILA